MEPAFFDVITLWHVLEHVHDLNQRLLKMRELLNPSGIVVIAVPNSGSWDAKHYQGAWAAYDLPRHLYHFTSETIRILAEKYGFSVKNIIPLKWDAFYISLLSEKYKTGSSKLARAILNGFRSNIFASRHKKNYSSLVFILEGPKNEI
jgi:SAM-dependent methyltransferase